MANTIKIKRGSGSDPAASDMVLGEPVLRTDTAELFFKKDDGSVAKVSGGGGGPDFKYLELRNAANNGAASYPGNDFTLVTAGTTTAISPAAANTLLVSVSGVIQKPNSGTSTSGITGFIVDGSRLKWATNIPAAPDFILYQESGGIGEPSDETVSEAKLKVSNSPVNGYFLSAQSGNTGGLTWAAPVATSCTGNSATATALATARTINGTNFDGTANITVTAAAGTLTGNTLNSSVVTSSLTSLGDLSGLTVTGNMAVDTNTLFVNASTDRVGIGTTSPLHKLEVENGTDQENIIVARGADASTEYAGMGVHGGNAIFTGGGVGSTSAGIVFRTAASGSEAERMNITSAGLVGIGTSSPETNLHVQGAGDGMVRITSADGSSAFLDLGDASDKDGGRIQYNTDSSLRFNTASTERLRLDSSGNVAIKTNDVALSGSGTLRVNSGSTSGALNLDGGATNHGGEINLTGGSNGGRIQFRTGQGSGQQNEKMRLDENGRLGIGTVSPAVKFVVSNGGAEGLEVSHSSGNVELNAYNRSTSARSPVGIVGQTFTVTTGNPNLNTGLFQNSSGNVGIGTTSPTDKLHVVGTALFASNTYVTGNLYVLADNKKIFAGAGSDARMYHDGTDSYFDSVTGNLYFYNHASNKSIIFGTEGNNRWKISDDGHFLPTTNNSFDIGSSSFRVRNIYTNDLNLSNEGGSNDVDGTWGSYTIQEGEESLFLINKRNGKKYRFNLTEVS
tara:strand:+ start:322 stop:2526 length:2205 start_codon:yes stop_codon:yes gene_type:complete